jgi:hypothetical protein
MRSIACWVLSRYCSWIFEDEQVVRTPSLRLPACLPALLPACLPACLLACLPARLPAYLPARRPACLPTCLPACLPMCAHVDVDVHVHVHLSICVTSILFFLSVILSIMTLTFDYVPVQQMEGASDRYFVQLLEALLGIMLDPKPKVRLVLQALHTQTAQSHSRPSSHYSNALNPNPVDDGSSPMALFHHSNLTLPVFLPPPLFPPHPCPLSPPFSFSCPCPPLFPLPLPLRPHLIVTVRTTPMTL